jgi:hypothetical protein
MQNLKSIPADNLPAYVAHDERAIAALIVSELIALGYALSVNDGEAWVVRKSQDAREVCAALASTGADVMNVRDAASGANVGYVSLIWGNGNCLLSDWGARPTPEGAAFGAAVETLADEIEHRFA